MFTTKLKTQLHETSGRAFCLPSTGRLISLASDRLQNIERSRCTPGVDYRGRSSLQSKTPGIELHSVEIAALKGNEGDQSYTVPRDTDLDRYNTVAIYCERFRAVFGSGTLQKF